jgi:ligand-binding sensor domain-containing protein
MKTRVLSLPHIITGMVLFLCLLNNTVAAKDGFKMEYSNRRYSVSDGLPENFCWDIYQDRRGYIWTATYNGFARYDGQKFTSYWHEKETNVMNVTENREGNITALSYSYYAVLDSKADTLKLIYNDGWRLIPFVSQNMPAGHFFYESTGKEEKALFLLSDTGLVKVWEHECLLKMDDYRKPYWDRANKKFYIPTQDGVFIVAEDGTQQDCLDIKSIRNIVSFRKTIWGLGSDGIYKLENGRFQLVYKQMLVHNPSGIEAIVDNENRLIIRDVEHIYRFDGTNLELIFINSMIFRVLFDAENNLWVATGDGLFNLFHLQFLNYKPLEQNNFARTLLADKKGNIWVGTYEGHLYQFKDNIQTEEHTPRKAGYSYFQGASARDEDKLYFPGGYEDGGVLCFSEGKGVWMNLPSMAYSTTLPLPENNILFGSYQGIIIYNKTTNKVIRQISRKELFLQPNCAALDKNGKILIGGSTGITVIDGDSIYLMNAPKDFLSCRNMMRDHTGKIWASSRNKLYTINGDSIEHSYTFNDHIHGMFVTNKNLMIVLTVKGINIKRLGDADFIRYDKNNGFSGEKIPITGIAEDQKGNVWFMADKCVVRFNPEELLQKQAVPKLYLQQVMHSADNINWISSEQDEYEFGYRYNNIKFTYIGLCYSATNSVKYQYRLRGFQNEWSEAQLTNEVIFNNLSPGNYTFELKANTGLPETETPVISVPFAIHPAFWQTVWFLVVIILALMLASAGIALFIQRRKNSALLERLETEKQLNELRIKSIRLKAIPHFNANVLAAIEYYIMNLSKTEALRLLGIYSRFTFQTLSEVDKASRSLSEELEYVKMYLELEKLRFVDKFDYRIEVEETVDTSVQLPNMILHTYCENAVKHGLSSKNAGGSLQIKVAQSGNIVCVSVEDNGVGREAAARNKNVPSSKQGLDILSRQIEIYNRFNQSKINQKVDDLYADGQPVGTRFTVEVPDGFVYQ